MRAAPILLLVTLAGVLASDNYYRDYGTEEIDEKRAEKISAMVAENALEGAIGDALDYLGRNNQDDVEPPIQINNPQVHNYYA